MAGAFEARGEERAIHSLERAPANFRIGLAEAAHMAGQVLVRTVQGGMTGGGKSGRVYGGHQASAPGEYSAVQSGALLGSVGYEVSGASYLRFGVGAEHGVYQELGTRKMGPRPNLQLAVGQSSATVTDLLGQVTYRRIVAG